MLSISPIAGGEQAEYYSRLGEAENHDYYSEEGNRPGTWWGSGAEALRLFGDVDPNEFKNVLDGRSPDGSLLLVQQRNGAQLKRRSGFDLTFSLPKSVSVLWGQGNQATREWLDEISSRALLKTLNVVQELCGKTRRGKNGVEQEAGKLVAAIFSHDTARGLPGSIPDCNRHYHVVLANLVVRQDGTTGALDARELFEPRAKMALGALFRAELSKLLETEMGLGTYRPEREHSKALASWFELACVPGHVREAFSKRRREIEKWLRKNGLTGARNAERAALRTRQVKGAYSANDLFRAWQDEGRTLGFSFNEVAAVLEAARVKEFDVASETKKAVEAGLKSIVEHAATFTEYELLERVAVEAQCCGVGIGEIRGAVREMLTKDHGIVRLRDGGLRSSRFTTRETLRTEQALISRAARMSRTYRHATTLQAVSEVLARYPTATLEQREVVRRIATGSDIVPVCGFAGTGKTWTLRLAREVLESEGMEVLGTALSAKAARGLEEGSGIRSLHIHALLQGISKGELTLREKSVLVVDEAGMVGTKHAAQLLRLVEEAGGKLVLVGDERQLQPVDAGNPFRKVSSELGAVELTGIIRQREEWSRKAVRELRDGNAMSALSAFLERGKLFMGEDREEAMERLVLDWRELVVERHGVLQDTLALAGTNLEVRELNLRMQRELDEAGFLGEMSVAVGGMEFHAADRVLVTKNDKLMGLRNGMMGEVVGVVDKTLTLRLDDGMVVDVDTEGFSSISLGYAVGVYKAQGVTVENAFVLTGDSMTDRELSYVASSRARSDTRLYADELYVEGHDELAALMGRSRGKDMALDYELEIV